MPKKLVNESLNSKNDTNNNSLSFLFGNIRGILPNNNLTKINVLNDLSKQENADIIIITESHLNEYISSIEIEIKDWTADRSDRSRYISSLSEHITFGF